MQLLDKNLLLMSFSIVVCFVFAYIFYDFDFKEKYNKLSKKINSFNAKDIEKKLENKIFKNQNNKQKHKSKILKLTQKDLSFGQKIKNSIFNVVVNKNHKFGFIQYSIATIILACIGFSIGNSLNNYGVAIVLCLLGAIIPYFFLMYRINIVNKDKDEKLLIVMANLTSSIMNTDNFEAAVSEILQSIPQPLYEYFKMFRDDIIYFNMDKIEAMKLLAEQVDNHFFDELIQLAIQYEYGESGLKYTMKAVPEDYKRYLDKNREYEKKVSSKNIEFGTILLCFPFVLGFLRITNKNYYLILIENPVGKLVLFAVLIIFIIGAFIFRKYNKEIKFEL